MSLPKLVFEVWPEFPFISERSAIRDFSRLSCQAVTCTAVQSKMNMVRCGQAMLERRPLRIREFEILPPHQPVRSPLCFFRVCENNLVRRALTQGRSPNVWSSSRVNCCAEEPGVVPGREEVQCVCMEA